MKNMAPNNANINSTTNVTPADRDAERNSRSGSSGRLVRYSRSTNSSPNTSAPPRNAIVGTEPQPYDEPLIRPQISRNSAPERVAIPGMSNELAAAFAAALAARPAGEEPLTAARHALQSSIFDLHGSTGRLTAYLAAMRLIDSTPTLLAAYLRSVHDHDDEIIEVLARREGVDPVADRRPRVLAAVIGALVFLANKDWQASDTESPEDLAAAFDSYADAVIPALAGHWT